MKTLRLDFIKCIIPKSQTIKHCLTFLSDAYLATKIPDMSGKNLTFGNPTLDGIGTDEQHKNDYNSRSASAILMKLVSIPMFSRMSFLNMQLKFT